MTAPLYDMVDLRLGCRRLPRIGGKEIIAMGPGLAADLARLGWTSTPALAWMSHHIAATAKDTAQEGEPKGWLYEGQIELWDEPGVKRRVWIERTTATQATIFYPSER